MTARIRFAKPDDASTLHRFICELAVYEREPDVVEVTPAELRAQLGQDPPPFECLLVEEPVGDAHLARGFALFFHNYSTWRGRPGLYLEDLYVSPEHRGRGHGRALLAALARLARARGCARMEWSVLDWNTPAIDFYEGLGATKMSQWRSFRLSDEALAELANSGRDPGQC
ncbi:putative acetyltransferase [Enhygromyxa salina]|uniref:Putative acetyltransferase n=1 Tax=Enhygromyxa salina TaxID=215803 RepID=A0A2S9XIJ5_9BACT|nr:GNAT family N-acetyltransferase [Enhygromyxa salina]PRP92657.1 putative acetyltransferase [Enhygromyxa salina]